LLNDCFLHDKDRLIHREAIALLKDRLKPIASTINVAIADAARRVLAQDISAPRDVPGYDNSAVDGYAFRHNDLASTGGKFVISQRIAAGDIEPEDLTPKTAVRIFTGAPVPEGADTIAMQEDCQETADANSSLVEIPTTLKPGANLRKSGEDLKSGDMVMSIGQRLRPQDLAAIASMGQDTIEVYKPLNVALLSSGNELVRPGEALKRGQVYDSNHYLLASLLSAIGAEITDYGILPDDGAIVRETIIEAASRHDVIISSGGASRGDEDHIIKTLDAIGSRHLWQLAIKPGRPMSFGQIGDTVMFGLPGNPVAGFVCFLLYVRPSILRLSGAVWQDPERFRMPVDFEIKHKKPDRREFMRGTIYKDESNRRVLRKFGRDGSGLITGLREADGLIEVPEETTSIKSGDMLDFIPFSQFF